MFGLKTLSGTIAIALIFVGYFPYIRSILKKQTKPHIYSWFVWTLDAFIIFGLQVTHGAGLGAYVTLAAALLGFTVFILTIFNKGKRDITVSDTVFFVIALIALVLWFFAKQPVISAILITAVDVIGFLPTVRKSWVKPFSENLPFYLINTVRFGFAFAAIKEYSIVTAFYPGLWFISGIPFCLMLILRRRRAK